MHHRTDIRWLVQVHAQGIAAGFQQLSIRGERFCDSLFAIVEIVEIVTVAIGIWFDQDRGPTGEVGIERPVLRQE